MVDGNMWEGNTGLLQLMLELVALCGNYGDVYTIYYLMTGFDFVNGLKSVYNDDEGGFNAQQLGSTDPNSEAEGEGDPEFEYEDSGEEIHSPVVSGDEADTIQQIRERRGLLVGKHTYFTLFQWKLLDVFKARPHWPAKDIIETVRRAYRAIVKPVFSYKVKWHAHKKLHGSMREHYGKVGRYLEVVKRSSPNTHLDLVTYMEKNEPLMIFQRLYVCFEGVQMGWNEGRRKIICVDACFLKTFLGVQLMLDVGRDGNDQMYPIAWEWFLKHLSNNLGLGEGVGVVIVSDEHQSILRGVEVILPNAEHRHYARHIYANWHKSFKGNELKLKFWSCAKAYSRADYEEALEKLTKADPTAVEAFKAYNPKLFYRAFIKTEVKSNAITSNMAETFNGYIIHAREKQLMYILEDIRSSLMKRLVTKKQEMEKWTTSICPRIQKKLEWEKEEAAKCHVIPSSSTLFQEVHLQKMGYDRQPLLPCCCSIFFTHRNAEDFVDDYYKKDKYPVSYSNSIPPLEGERHWPRSDLVLDPPPIKIGPGRPRKNRIRDPFEDPKKPGKLTKHDMEMTYSVCNTKGHNKRSCPSKGTTTTVEPPPN
ncbi:uncharacterized protein LOC110721234 [Chenopodium quinoa]|uniref:uncharacterized protein LOC110721234 n=1 Tax=Chenopodium quinoa TaxID=63459 RepID=UPI000B7833A4|nr:uncharacterized protein LOC110721234 [Chenopodium quinoa]